MDAISISFSPGLISVLQRAHTKQQEVFLNPALGTKGLIAAFLSMSPDELSADRELGATDFASVRTRFREILRERLTEEAATPEATQQAAQLLQQWNQAIELVPASLPKLNNDQPWTGPSRDRLGIANDGIAIANVAAGQSTSLPLAFGIFGDWGAGKTFFMRLIHDQIARVVAFRSENDGLEHAIVQIQFNAWHYAETNLWASLVGHIFDELDRWMTRDDPDATTTADDILKRLATSRQLTLEAAIELVQRRKENARAGDALVTAQKVFAQAQEKAACAPNLVWRAALTTAQNIIAADSELKQQMASIQSAFALPELAEDKAKLALALDEVKRSASAGNAALGSMRATLGNGTTVPLAIAVLIGVPVILFVLRQLLFIVPSLAGLAEVGRGFEELSGLLGAAAVLFRTFAVRARSLADKLTGLRQCIDREIAKATAAEQTKMLAAEVELAKKAAAVEQAKSVLQATSEQVAAALRDYVEETGGMRLRRFVRSRAGEQGYAKHLGLVSTIRKDFEQLESLMLDEGNPAPHLEEARKHYAVRVEALITSAGEALSTHESQQLRETAKSMRELELPEKMRFRRIVLYIDDLDRCEPDKVVEVLQAVNMLLSFRLFVVMVAVDARWLSRSLETKYKDFFGTVAGKNSAGDNGAAHPGLVDAVGIGWATPADYLEKIFQVPYWVPPMGETSSLSLVDDLVSSDRSAEPKQPMAPVGTIPGDPYPLPQFGVFEAEDDQRQTLSPPIRALGLTPNEITALTELAPFLGGSPRRARRFINVYRVAKASLAPDEIKKLEGGDFRGLATQLAIGTGAPNIFGTWAAACSDSRMPIEERLSEKAIEGRLGNLVVSDEEWQNFRKAVNTFKHSAGTGPWVMQALADQAPRAARFSFVVPHRAMRPRNQEPTGTAAPACIAHSHGVSEPG